MTESVRPWRTILAAAIVAAPMLLVCPAGAQDGGVVPTSPPPAAAPAAVPADLASPRATLRTFLVAMRAEDDAQATRCLDLSTVDASAGKHLADLLLDTLDRIEFVSYSEHPDQWMLENVADLRSITRWTVFPREDNARHRQIVRRYEPEGSIVLARGEDGAWRFGAETVAGISALHDSLREMPLLYGEGAAGQNLVLRLEEQLPASLVETKFLTVKGWQWIGLLGLIVVGLTLDLAVRLLLTLIARRMITRRGGDTPVETLRRTVRPFGLAAAGLFWLGTIGLLGLPPPALQFLLPAVRTFAMLAAVWAAFRLTDLLTEVLASRAAGTRTKIDDLLVPLVRKTAKVFITAIGLIYLADSFDIEILPLLTGLGIGTLAFGLAAKDSIENLFGSVAVITDRPFEVGDWVKIGDVEGTVEELGFRSTRIRTFYNSLVTMPNATLVRAVVDNYGRRKYRRWTTHLGVTYDTPPERLESFCEGIRELIRVHPFTRKDYYQVWLHKFGPSSLDILLYVFHEAPDWQTELRERHRLMLDIIRLAQHLDVELAFPTQTLHVQTEDGAAAPAPPEVPPADREGQALRDGRLAVRRLTEHAPWRREKPGPYRFEHEAGGDDEDDTQIESRVGGDAG
ncbi:MAG: mechanosensitive ion channel family protein [Planctomycetota bacterium]